MEFHSTACLSQSVEAIASSVAMTFWQCSFANSTVVCVVVCEEVIVDVLVDVTVVVTVVRLQTSEDPPTCASIASLSTSMSSSHEDPECITTLSSVHERSIEYNTV